MSEIRNGFWCGDHRLRVGTKIADDLWSVKGCPCGSEWHGDPHPEGNTPAIKGDDGVPERESRQPRPPVRRGFSADTTPAIWGDDDCVPERESRQPRPPARGYGQPKDGVRRVLTGGLPTLGRRAR